MICAELSTVAWFVPNYRQLRDLCRTIESYAICAEISTVAWIVRSYWQSHDLCRTFGLTSRHLIVFSLHNTTYVYFVDALLMFLELQTSMSQSHIQACERVSMLQQKHYYSCIHRARRSVFLGKRNVGYRCLTFHHALYSSFKYHKMKWNSSLNTTNGFISQEWVRLSNYMFGLLLWPSSGYNQWL